MAVDADTQARAAATASEPETPFELLSGWGNTSPSCARVRRPRSLDELAAQFPTVARRGAIARGLGRSYGDLAQNAGGLVLDLSGLDKLESFDPQTGLLTGAAGCSLARIITEVLPRGWFLPVVPGTRSITLGGAVACDVHGKNHHVDGSFADHVRSLRLLTPAGELRELDRDATPGEFRATVGGIGLTGVIVSVTLQLLRVAGPMLQVTTEQTTGIDETLARLTATDHLYRYSVAWIDGAAQGRRLGRGVLMRGDHAPAAAQPAPAHTRGNAGKPRLKIPRGASISPLIGNTSLAAFNELYFRRAHTGSGALQDCDSFFFPLDAVGSWNRLYGRAGFLQYQFVVPFGAEETLVQVMELLASGRRRPTLVVLKRFGGEGGGLSFPIPGWTLASDLPLPAPGLAALLDRADELVARAGGRVYLAKDSRLRPERFREMYPELERWRELRARLDPGELMQSDLARRLQLSERAEARR